ncbi:SUMF1/EgtB/PvdO family nonheme iron enzyme [Candidatus Poribacteria bacterium]|nr:SUMF1/EgtB/PvdO family nonheme iron enzyme [Candidatus Poribacteria bacterium]
MFKKIFTFSLFICLISVCICSLAMADAKVVIRSVPMVCQVSINDESFQKSEYQLIKELPAGKHKITFTVGEESLSAEFEIAQEKLLVRSNFRLGAVWITSGIEIGNDDSPMVLIPAGEFKMGSDFGEPDEYPVHEVYLDDYYIDVYEVTNAQYKVFMEKAGYRAPRYWNDPQCNAPDQPVVGVTWNDALMYCNWAGKRLPTEAEWEKAARGGLVQKVYPWGDEHNTPVAGGGGNTGVAGAASVGSFAPNPFGLHDMVRNAWEWCIDWYGEDYYANSPAENPEGPDTGDVRVLRGGSWFAGVANPLRTAYRYSYEPDKTSNLIGFRCVVEK